MRSSVSRTTVTSWASKQVKMFEDRAGEAVLNGNRSGIGFAAVQCCKHVRRERTRHDLRAWHKLQCRFVAERTGLSLNRNSHLVECRPMQRGIQRQFPFAPYHSVANACPVPCLLSDWGQCQMWPWRIHKSADTNARNTMAMTPFIVKKAAFMRRRSRGETIECS